MTNKTPREQAIEQTREFIEPIYRFWTGNSPHPDFTSQIYAIYESLGYVQLDQNQDLPKNPIGDFGSVAKGQQWAYETAQKDMLKAGFKKCVSNTTEEKK